MRIRIIDAFTDQPFAGNPAGVCLLDAGTWPNEAWMRQVAAELGHETAFARPLPDGAGADWALRWFTPAAESNVCGHATLATAHALHTDRATPPTVRFASNFGLLVARTHDDAITLDFPDAFPAEAPAPDGLAQALGAKRQVTYRTGALGDLLAAVGDEAAVRSLRPDFTALTASSSGTASAGSSSPPPRRTGTVVMTSSPGTSRQLAASPKTPSPAAPIPRWPYWSHRFGRDSLTGLQASDCTGLVHTAVHGDGVHLTGHAVTVLDGTLDHNAGRKERLSTWVQGRPSMPERCDSTDWIASKRIRRSIFLAERLACTEVADGTVQRTALSHFRLCLT